MLCVDLIVFCHLTEGNLNIVRVRVLSVVIGGADDFRVK